MSRDWLKRRRSESSGSQLALSFPVLMSCVRLSPVLTPAFTAAGALLELSGAAGVVGPWGRRAVLRHAHVDGGRPDAFRLGVMTVENAWAIHRRCLPSRTRRDSLWFLWAFTADTLIQAPAIGRPPGPAWRLAHARGRLTGLLRLLLDGAAGRS